MGDRPRTLKERLDRVERGLRVLRGQFRQHVGKRSETEVIGFMPDDGWLDEDDLEVPDGGLEPICHQRGPGDAI